MATEPKQNNMTFSEQEKKIIKRALNKLDQSTSRFLTTSMKEENEVAVASAKEELAAIAVLRTKL